MKNQITRASALALMLGLGANAMAADPLVQFSRGIGVDPVAGIATTGLPVPNTVLGVPPGGRPWVIHKLRASFYADGTMNIRGNGLLFSGGDNIGTRGTVAQVKATLFCAGVGHDSPPADLDLQGNFTIKGRMLATPPNPCATPVLLIRSLGGNWFAAGVVGDDD